ncbi:MAG TPA: tetratricopeptide repeat protein [Ferrovibrio sp.]|uniref:O-linked N-acetylglucosamine transferase, SPINDLY family protein n=1 Tax=Ferrovibrio sp. TaxID=1917215 RepID=UPI002ED6AAEF
MAPSPIQPDAAADALQAATELHRAGRFDEAAALYETVLAAWPDHAEALSLLGLLHSQRGRHADAYPLLKRAMALAPSPKLSLALATCLYRLGRAKDALPHFDRALQAMPDQVEARKGRAAALFDAGRYAEALADFDMAAAAQALSLDMQISRLFAAGMLCRWQGDEDGALAAALRAAPPGKSVSPFPLTFFIDDPALLNDWNGRRAAHLIERRRRAGPQPLRAEKLPQVRPRPAAEETRRLRIGYLSDDLRGHAVGHIMADLFDCHDRRRFDVLVLSTARDDNSDIRRRYAAMDGFVDLHGLNRSELETAIRRAELDILIDLQGHTIGSFCDLLSQRLVPLQLDWIGYPGSIGGGFIDYIIADPFVIPAGAEGCYAEKIIRLPHCYQPNNRQRAIARPLPRRDYGLPDEAMVFCCFNRPVKIRPKLFAAWMEILRAVPHGVLWLYAPYPETAANLRREAEKHGLDPARLHFAAGLPQDQYLARYQAADLVLDTYPYGSHSTASDSLWAGCPLLTLAGASFQSRVAGSILHAIGLPELAAASLNDYIATAIRLGNDRAALAALRRRLHDNRLTMPLFDTPRIARNLEAAYEAIWARHRRGLPPEHIALPPL